MTDKTITIDNVEYNFDDMSDRAKALVNHCMSLEAKIQKAQFDLEQHAVAKGKFFELLQAEVASAKANVPNKGKANGINTTKSKK